MIATCHYSTAERPESSCVRFMQHLAATTHKHILSRTFMLPKPTNKPSIEMRRKPVNKEAIQAAIEELLTGSPIIATAAKHKVDPTTLRRHAEKAGWKKSKDQYSAEYKKEILESISAGESVTECAKRTGLPLGTIYKWLWVAGYKSRPQYVAPVKEVQP